jgi:hypothetical protein
MSERKARIDLTNLPVRPRRLKSEELQQVFGGCFSTGNLCGVDSDCCPTTPYCKDYSISSTGMGTWPYRACSATR